MDANEVKEEPSENVMKRVMSAEASILGEQDNGYDNNNWRYPKKR